MMMRYGRLLALSILLAQAVPSSAQSPWPQPPAPDAPVERSRLFVLSDIGNEPDDQMSFVRLLLYSNEIDIEGLVATTSVFQREATHPETFREILADYDKVRPNLLLHSRSFPTYQYLLSRVSAGQPGYGMAAVGPGKASAGAKALVEAVDRKDTRPLWVTAWGGTNTLAQALLDVRNSRSAADLNAFVAKLRIYAISDQDDAGRWIRREFPQLSFIVTPSSQDGSEFSGATWTGISGDRMYRNGDGADFSLVTNEWLDTNIRSKGILGLHYPHYPFIMEGDTPSYLALIHNGLESYRSPSWGGWGGRYVYRQSNGETRPIWTQGGDAVFQVDSRDEVTGTDGSPHISDQATIWRWRDAFQRDFAARMAWTITSFDRANHAPAAVLNGVADMTPLVLKVKVGASIDLDASASRDPDGDQLHYRWFHYQEAGFSGRQGMANVSIAGADKERSTITATTNCRPIWIKEADLTTCKGIAHVILAVTDNGQPALTSYRRVILEVSP